MTDAEKAASEATQRLYNRLNQARANNGGSVPKEEWLRIGYEEFLAEIDAAHRAPKKKRVKGERDVLFDTLAVCCGYNLKELSRDAGRVIGSSIASIREVCEELTPEEIKKRVLKYQMRHRDRMPTPKAIANDWAKLGDGKSDSDAPAFNVYKEPGEWLKACQRQWGMDVGGQIHARGWLVNDTNIRLQILKDISIHALAEAPDAE